MSVINPSWVPLSPASVDGGDTAGAIARVSNDPATLPVAELKLVQQGGARRRRKSAKKGNKKSKSCFGMWGGKSRRRRRASSKRRR
jgi:hypothetical protein